LKDKIEKIFVSYYLSDAYSNYACRFYIKVDFFDYQNLDLEEKRIVQQYLYNSSNETGSQFVSFIYQSNHDLDIDFKIVEDFIYHYEFARNLFDGFIRTILPQTCLLEIDDLESVPFFVYMIPFLRGLKYSEMEDLTKTKSFSKKYFQINQRAFEFDCHFHQILKEAATPILNDTKTISDEELYRAGCGAMTDLRRFVVEAKIPFSISSHSSTINSIQIDTSVLKTKIKNDLPENLAENIRPDMILNLLEKKDEELVAAKEKLDRKCMAAGIKTGDYIYVNKGGQRVGVIKKIELCYNDDLKIQYNVLKNDLTESHLPPKEIYCRNECFYTLRQEVVEEKQSNGVLKTKQQLTVCFRKEGVKNVLLKGKKT
ncbi:MAG: hypothetical protein LBI18_14110, partial [Planctomycetaceae bacterium]|nr:hypothetical protein [Planctomycetaceae bacterium]